MGKEEVPSESWHHPSSTKSPRKPPLGSPAWAPLLPSGPACPPALFLWETGRDGSHVPILSLASLPPLSRLHISENKSFVQGFLIVESLRARWHLCITAAGALEIHVFANCLHRLGPQSIYPGLRPDRLPRRLLHAPSLGAGGAHITLYVNPSVGPRPPRPSGPSCSLPVRQLRAQQNSCLLPARGVCLRPAFGDFWSTPGLELMC